MQNTIQEYIIALTDRAEQAGDEKLTYAIEQISKLLNSCNLPNDLISCMESYVEKEVVTTEHYWDCECDEKFIHKKSDRLTCPVCGSAEDDSPDSRVRELTKRNLF